MEERMKKKKEITGSIRVIGFTATKNSQWWPRQCCMELYMQNLTRPGRSSVARHCSPYSPYSQCRLPSALPSAIKAPRRHWTLCGRGWPAASVLQRRMERKTERRTVNCAARMRGRWPHRTCSDPLGGPNMQPQNALKMSLKTGLIDLRSLPQVKKTIVTATILLKGRPSLRPLRASCNGECQVGRTNRRIHWGDAMRASEMREWEKKRRVTPLTIHSSLFVPLLRAAAAERSLQGSDLNLTKNVSSWYNHG